MINILIDSKTSVSEYRNQLRVYFLNRILIVFLVLAIFGIPVSLSRALTFGWQPIYILQLFIGIFVVILHLFPNRSSSNNKLGV